MEATEKSINNKRQPAKGKMVVVGGVEQMETNNVKSTANSVNKNHHRTSRAKEGFHPQTQPTKDNGPLKSNFFFITRFFNLK